MQNNAKTYLNHEQQMLEASTNEMVVITESSSQKIT